jgi:hypothetical protein
MDGRMMLKRSVFAVGVVALFAVYGCERPNPYKIGGEGQQGTNCPPIDGATASATGATAAVTTGVGVTASSGTGQQATTGGAGAGGPGPQLTELDERVLDYSEAFRTASLKLVGTLPALDQIYQLSDAADVDKLAVYTTLLDNMFADTRFIEQMIRYHRQIFKISDRANPGKSPSRDTAPVFASRVVAEGQDWRNIIKATSNTCPTWDGDNKVFVDGECNNGITPVGILTDPGIMAVYYGNMAFRRNRFVHETFLCRSANSSGGAEPSDIPSQIGPPAAPQEDCTETSDCTIGMQCESGKCTNERCGVAAPGNYTQPWPMDQLAGICNGGNINFHEWNTTVVCANCHSTWNHRAPLWAKFDQSGMYIASDPPNNKVDFQVHVPVPGDPLALLSDWLPASEAAKAKPFAWKYSADDSQRVANLGELGDRMAADEEVLSCAVKRSYNWAMSRGDIIFRGAAVPNTVIAEHLAVFKANNYDMKATFRAIFLHDDFLRF